MSSRDLLDDDDGGKSAEFNSILIEKFLGYGFI